MIRFICKEFDLDITKSGVNFITENFWFKDTLFSEYSLPFSMNMTDELRNQLGFFFHPNTDVQTIFEGSLMRDGNIDKAVLSITSFNRKNIKMNILVDGNYVSSWNTSLSGLNLQRFELQEGETLTSHALSVIGQQYPAVNYNFPMIFTTKYDDSDATFAFFKKFLNYFENGVFLDNTIDTDNNIIYNYNIMQPMPYLMHVLMQGFADANLQLTGDILTDEDIQKALIVAVVDYFNTSDQTEIEAFANYDDFYELYTHEYDVWEWTMAKYLLERDIVAVGEYRIVGKINMNYAYMANEKIIIKYGDEILAQYLWDGYSHGDFVIDIDVSFTAGTIDIDAGKKVTIYVEDEYSGQSGRKIELNINPIRYHNLEGDASNVIYMPNEVNLTRTVPDMTFGNLVKAVMNWKNFDLEIIGDTVVMNYITNSLDRSKAVDLREFTTYYPDVTFNQDLSFELHFVDDDTNPDFVIKRMFVDASGAFSDNYETKDDTNEVIINLLPLPNIQADNIETSYLVGDGEDKLYLAFFEGIINDLPVAVQRPTTYFPELYNNYLREWFEFRIKTKTFTWGFYMPANRVDEIKRNRLVFAFDNYFIVRKIEKSRDRYNMYKVKLECDMLLI